MPSIKPLTKKSLLQKGRIQSLTLSIAPLLNPTRSCGQIKEDKEHLTEVEDYLIGLKKLQAAFFKIIHPLAKEKKEEEEDTERIEEDTEEVESGINYEF